jgi:acyl carrier protein
MNKADIVEKLKQTMKESSQDAAEWDTITEDTTVESLGFDSLSILDLIYDIQQAFEIEFDAEEMVTVSTVGELATFLEAKTAE